MERGLVAVGYAIGAGLVLASRRGQIPRPKLSAWNSHVEVGFRAVWLGVSVEAYRPKRARP